MSGEVKRKVEAVFAVWSAVPKSGKSASALDWSRVAMFDDRDVAVEAAREMHSNDKSHGFVVTRHHYSTSWSGVAYFGLDDTVQPECAGTCMYCRLGVVECWRHQEEIARFALMCCNEDTVTI